MVGLSKLAVRCCCVKRHTLFFSYKLLKEHCSRGERRSSHCCCVVLRHAILHQMWLVSSSCWWHGVCSCSNCDCLALSSVCGALIRVVKLLGGRVQFEWCCQVGWRHRATVAVFKSDCEVTRSSSCLAAGYNRDGVVKFVGGTVQQLLCLKVTARYLGSNCGLKLGRQAAWRPGTIGMVSSNLLAALCKQLLCLKVIARYLGSGCGFKFGRQAAWRLEVQSESRAAEMLLRHIV